MCTLILGYDVVAPGSVVLAANRDEDPARPCEAPGVLSEAPRVVGGRDLKARGTWLAVRERRAAVAMLNRRENVEPGAPERDRRSRGLLALEAGIAEDPARLTIAALAQHSYGSFSLVFASPSGCWRVEHGPSSSSAVGPIAPGWHVQTHSVLDDRTEPRTAWLCDRLAGFAPRSPAEAIARLTALLKTHADGDAPPVCIHHGRMVTVSASIVYLATGEASYLHAEGRPCEARFTDYTHLLAGAEPARERA